MEVLSIYTTIYLKERKNISTNITTLTNFILKSFGSFRNIFSKINLSFNGQICDNKIV